MKTADFAAHLTEFLSHYLPELKNISTNTISSYCDAFRLFLGYCQDVEGMRIEKLSIDDLTPELVDHFLQWLRIERNNGTATRSQRLAAIRSFVKYLQIKEPRLLLNFQQILAIPVKRAERKAINPLTKEAIGFSQNQPWIFCCFSWIAFLPAPCHCVCTGIALIKNQEETNMTIDTAKELQMNIAKEGLALLVLHPTADVQLHRECISHIGTAWDIPVGDTQEVISLLDRELDAIHAAEKNGTVTHVLPEEELPMNASGLETLDNIWDLFETSLRVDSPYARTRLFEMAKWLEESQNLLDWIEKTPAEKQAWMEQVS